MTKFLLVIAVVGVLLWLMLGRRREADVKGRRDPAPPKPVAMIACAHCGVHLPQSDALFDAGGRPFCGEPHRVAGPR